MPARACTSRLCEALPGTSPAPPSPPRRRGGVEPQPAALLVGAVARHAVLRQERLHVAGVVGSGPVVRLGRRLWRLSRRAGRRLEGLRRCGRGQRRRRRRSQTQSRRRQIVGLLKARAPARRGAWHRSPRVDPVARGVIVGAGAVAPGGGVVAGVGRHPHVSESSGSRPPAGRNTFRSALSKTACGRNSRRSGIISFGGRPRGVARGCWRRSTRDPSPGFSPTNSRPAPASRRATGPCRCSARRACSRGRP